MKKFTIKEKVKRFIETVNEIENLSLNDQIARMGSVILHPSLNYGLFSNGTVLVVSDDLYELLFNENSYWYERFNYYMTNAMEEVDSTIKHLGNGELSL